MTSASTNRVDRFRRPRRHLTEREARLRWLCGAAGDPPGCERRTVIDDVLVVAAAAGNGRVVVRVACPQRVRGIAGSLFSGRYERLGENGAVGRVDWTHRRGVGNALDDRAGRLRWLRGAVSDPPGCERRTVVDRATLTARPGPHATAELHVQPVRRAERFANEFFGRRHEARHAEGILVHVGPPL